MLAADGERLGGRQLERELLRPIMNQLEGFLIDSGRDRLVLDPCGFEHLMADRARGSEDQGQANNLVENAMRYASAALGTGSTGSLSEPREQLFEDSSTGTDSIPKL